MDIHIRDVNTHCVLLSTHICVTSFLQELGEDVMVPGEDTEVKCAFRASVCNMAGKQASAK